jgi:hypothetical protein
MKTGRLLLLISFLSIATASCSAFKPKYGCPSNGKNVGAENLLNDSKARKAKKFRA